MPRLRKLKSFDVIHVDYEAPDEHDTVQTPNTLADTATSNGRGTTTETTEYVEQRGWWSDGAIIASLPDAKLRDAYHRYRALAEQCSQEIARRKAAGVVTRAREEFDVITGKHRYVNMGRESGAVQANRRSTRSRQHVTTLTPQQMLQALDLLTKLKIKEPRD